MFLLPMRAKSSASLFCAGTNGSAVDLAAESEEATLEDDPDFVLGRCEAVAEHLRQLLGQELPAHRSVESYLHAVVSAG
jgi:hypothetical protein